MSKVFSHTNSFVPEKILPHGADSATPTWQEMPAHKPFTSDATIINNSTPEPPPDKLTTSPLSEPEAPAVAEQREPAVDLELIRRQAFAAGVEEGKRQSYADFAICGNTFRQACDQLTRVHETILRNNVEEMHELIMIIAEKVIRHSITEQNETILTSIEEAIRLAVKSDEFHIRINPDDLDIIKQKRQDIINSISGLDNIVLKADRTVERGGCIIESANCTVDATIDGQLQMIREALHNHASLLPPPSDNDEEQAP